MDKEREKDEMTTREKLRRRNAVDDQTHIRWRLFQAEQRRKEREEAERLDKLMDDLREGNVTTEDDL